MSGWTVQNVGWLVHEDDDCIIIAARQAFDAEPPQVGLAERHSEACHRPPGGAMTVSATAAAPNCVHQSVAIGRTIIYGQVTRVLYECQKCGRKEWTDA